MKQFIKNLICKLFGHEYEPFFVNDCKYCIKCYNNEIRRNNVKLH